MSYPHDPRQQPGGWSAPPPPALRPPKKKKTGIIIGLSCLGVVWLVVMVSFIGGLFGGDEDPDTSAKPKPTASTKTPEAKPKQADNAKLDDAGKFACDDFAKGFESAQTRQARMDLADKVNKWAPKSKTDRIADMAVALANGSESSDSAWQLGADAFAKACLDAGWKGN